MCYWFLQSGGELENDEQTANKVMNIVKTTLAVSNLSEGMDGQPANFKKLSGTYMLLLALLCFVYHLIKVK